MVKDLKRLKSVERPANILAIEEARAHGDLSENAEYSAAKEKQSFLEGKIIELEDKIARAQIIDISKICEEKIVFGAKIKLMDLDIGTEVSYQIVGDTESDISKGKISISSPIAKALIGKHVGDEVTINVPKGKREFEVLDIVYS
ncbi:MAG: transcription elongation factor GreA [Candidatus Acididesulfobacter guangdongensis]|uniref:Transcription elongation factor GreA n=1 Tax=Acididesulfobacter guangdongensis TaxID=2597225 RepID=A0A519BJL9_ACIG2|nr:MAG: transcription elongation factor GreA [Candidatus Acididesulfobacter guangdongensis]